MSTPDLAVIGGSGFYTFLDDPETVEVETPYGPPSAPIAVGTVGDRTVAFLPRHGAGPPVPGPPGAVPGEPLGAAQPRRPADPGAVRRRRAADRTTARARSWSPTSWSIGRRTRVQTYYDEGAIHVSFADPYCRRLRGHLVDGLDGHAPGGRRRDGRHRGPAVLHPRRVAVVRRPGLGGRRHDRAPGGSARPRARALLRHRRARHRPRRRCRRGRRRSAWTRCSGCSPSTPRRSSRCSPTSSGAVGTDRDCACSHAVDGMDLPFELP